MSDCLRTQIFMKTPEPQEGRPKRSLGRGWGWLLLTYAVLIPQVGTRIRNSPLWFPGADPPWN